MKDNLGIGSLLKNRMSLLIGLTAFLLTGSLVLASRHSRQASEAATALTSRISPCSSRVQGGSSLLRKTSRLGLS